MATTLPLALVQLQPGENALSNRSAAEAWLERALDPPPGTPRPKWLMLPEIWNAPYAAECFADHAEPVPRARQPVGRGALALAGDGGPVGAAPSRQRERRLDS